MTFVLYLTLIIAISYCLWKFPVRRTIVAFHALVTALAGLICSVLAVVSYRIPSDISVVRALLFFYGIYLSFAFVPGLYAFLIISRQTECPTGELLSFFGFIWVSLTISTGLAMSVTATHDGLLFFYLSNWALVLISISHNLMNFYRLGGKASKTIMFYSWLNIVSVIFFVVIAFPPVPISSDISFFMSLVLCDLPIAAAMLIAVLNGYLWTDQTLVGSKLDYVETIV